MNICWINYKLNFIKFFKFVFIVLHYIHFIIIIYFEKNYDSIYKEIFEYLELNPDMLDFDPANKDIMKYYIEKNQLKLIN